MKVSHRMEQAVPEDLVLKRLVHCVQCLPGEIGILLTLLILATAGIGVQTCWILSLAR